MPVITNDAPGRPVLSGEVVGADVVLSFTADEGDAAITEWKIYRGTTAYVSYLATDLDGGETDDYTDLAPGGEPLFYQVVAINENGQGPPSNVIQLVAGEFVTVTEDTDAEGICIALENTTHETGQTWVRFDDVSA